MSSISLLSLKLGTLSAFSQKNTALSFKSIQCQLLKLLYFVHVAHKLYPLFVFLPATFSGL